MGLSGVILPLKICDMMLPRVTIPITDLVHKKKESRNNNAQHYPVVKFVPNNNISQTCNSPSFIDHWKLIKTFPVKKQQQRSGPR